ncbi:tRNA (N(6)-L-threonylcarbamoyladenosine(37)-C(2))-methylthiotransferase MtaB [Adlercreutzia equolifaciens]|uniref:tRNA (N(6)-L-threonylcarbamoyladenosine(37)-C(2))- methylthiotransferase MtaB n=1 Tax=Adlercreutzia equolifaciens TaxID=446660 RepID=UPI0023B1ED93|nr:tRNA (N(6)-L-threonylcarbamoyladenosine(37)-C(2))-methylthiotransferase MtaB [Adlercreutzia equolifaciens]MDE8703213.1 tRNA (N(6)-L-threonylcarbamoyladenosine(37)-C(2))-methylthiotransferase MtaB [Adlercreutzia equolifaciens]
MFCVVNLGCKVNRVESDGFERLLAERGGVPAPEAEADLIVVNTCTVTGEAEKKTRKAVRHALNASAGAQVIVTGCATEIDQETYASLGERVTVVPKAEAAIYLAETFDGAGEASSANSTPAQDKAGADSEDTVLASQSNGVAASPMPSDGRTRIGIKVQDGCDNACTYCIVHVARGRATSRSADEVVAEATALARAGVREIVLTGINLGSYDDEGCDLADLCRRLLEDTADLHEPGEPPCRFRIGSIEPMDVSMDFIGLLADAEGRLCRHLHLPLQSGSSKVLREMARPYDAEEYRQLVDYLRAMVPEIALTTDIIVGFPGETEENFEDTVKLAQHCGFSKIHVFPYSRREGTPAAQRPDQVPPDVKAARAARLRQLSDELAAADRANRAGTTELALVETSTRATTESYHEIALTESCSVGSLVTLAL